MAARDRKHPITESILICLMGQRAAGIYGDLVEMAATRGAGWFWMAYARTLLLFVWRMPTAFLAAMAGVWAMSQLYPMWVQAQVYPLPAGWQVDMFFGRVAVVSRPFLLAIAMCLWFALPFAWLAYGRKDRLTRFALALLLATLPVFSYRAWLMDAACVATLALLLNSAFSSAWRRPLLVLAVTCVVEVAAVVLVFRWLAMRASQTFAHYTPARGARDLAAMCALGLAALVCATLHRQLLARQNVAA